MNLSKTATKLLLLCFVFITIESFGASGIVSITDNGMHVFTKLVKSAPIISMSFWVRAGSVNDVIGREGYANLVRKLVLAGTDKNPNGQLDKKLRDIGATYSSFTLTDYTCFSFNFPSSKKNEVIKLTCDAIFNSNFSAENVEREKKICVQELKVKNNNPNMVVQDILMANAFKKHPYKNPVQGTVESVIKSNRDELYRFYKKYYVPANMWLVAVGDLSHEEIIDTVRKEVASIPKVSVPMVNISKEAHQTARKSCVKYGNLTNSYICLGWHVPEAKDSDSVVLDVISMLLRGRENSKINKVLVKTDKVGFAAGIAYFTSLYPSLFMVAGIASQGNTAEFIERAVEYVYKLKKDNSVSVTELDKAKSMIISNYIFNNETVEAQSLSYGFYAMTSNINDQEKYVENVKKVTLLDIQRVAKEYFNDNSLTIARYEPTIVSDDSKPVMVTLDNGVRLILKEVHSSPVVSIVASVGAGTAREGRFESGIANITSKLIFNRNSSKSGKSLAEKLDSVGARINTDVSHSFVSFDMKTLPKSFIQSLELFIEKLTSSKFSESEIKQVKEKAIAELEMKELQPFNEVKNAVIDKIFPKSSLSTPLQGTKKGIKRISRSKIKSFHKKNYVGHNIVIAIVGDFFVRENKEKILDVLGEIDDGKVKDYKLLKTKSISKDKILEFKINSSEGQVVFVSPTFPVNDERNYGMQIVNRVLMNNMKGRIEKELKYKPVTYESENISVVNGGYFISTTTLPAQLVGSCTEILKKEFENIRKNGLPKKDIEEAKNMLKGQYLLSFSSDSARGLIMSADEIVGKGFDSYLKYSNNIASTSKSIIDNIAKAYLPASGTYLIGITKP